MRIMGGVSGKVMSQPKERKELWGRELQVEGNWGWRMTEKRRGNMK